MGKSNITEEHKLRLADYLLCKVREGISGRDENELVDIQPFRAIFAGVLSPPRQIDIDAAHNRRNSEIPAGTSLGTDFRVVFSKEEIINLEITPEWAFYYPVFPTWEQINLQKVIYHQENSQKVRTEELELIDNPKEIFSQEDQEDLVYQNSDEGVDSFNDRLPIVFKRFNVKCPPISIKVSKENLDQISIGKDIISNCIKTAKENINLDPRLWRHLGEEKEHIRTLKNSNAIYSEETYKIALESQAREKVTLPPWDISLLVEVNEDTDNLNAKRIRVLIANVTPERDLNSIHDKALEERAIFDAKLTIHIKGGSLLPFDFLLAPKDYRCNPTMPARGINCTVNWNDELGIIETESLPIFRQQLYRTRTDYDVKFSELTKDQPEVILKNILKGMNDYLEKWDRFLKDRQGNNLTEDEQKACQKDRDAFAKEINNFALGIEVLSKDKFLLKAFRLANFVFQRIGEASNGRITSWRLFQLGFIISQLPSLAVREITKASDDSYLKNVMESFQQVGVLWFPTGGGKTEAYLGLLAIAMLYDRLRGKTRGVTAWMRFPLRMLSLQQLERLATVIAELNKVRETEKDIAKGDPFAIGYFVGDSVTPNKISSDLMDKLEGNPDFCKRYRLLRKCPYCGDQVEMKVLRESWRLVHVCKNANCFSYTSKTLGFYTGILPICIVDNEIYRYLPSILVGTVDKLAVAGSSLHFSHIVRGINQRCKRHEYMSHDQCIEKYNAKCKLSKSEIEILSPIKDPGPSLLIQDELHLLKAELGVFDGHYEGLLQYLCSLSSLPPKVLAATATIEAYDVHTFHLYLSRSCRYPQPSWEEGESFYATSRPLRYRRLYMGILAHTRSVEDPIQRILYLYWYEIRKLQKDPRKVATIMNDPSLSDEDIYRTLRLYDLSLGYVNRKATGGSLNNKMSMIEKKLEALGLGSLETKLLTGDSGSEAVGETIDRVNREKEDTNGPRLSQIFATNLISHGVDLERINMMVMCGMPSHYAEYVQATSRAARSHPGCVFVCFNGRDPRELSQFEFFIKMHEHMDRLIEAVAINRFASFAPDKTLPGLLGGVLLNKYSPELYKQYKKTLAHIPTLKQALGFSPGGKILIDQNELLEILERIIGVDHVRPPASAAQIKHVRARLSEVFSELMALIGRTSETNLIDVLGPLISFRDVDEGIDFASPNSISLLSHLGER